MVEARFEQVMIMKTGQTVLRGVTAWGRDLRVLEEW